MKKAIIAAIAASIFLILSSAGCSMGGLISGNYTDEDIESLPDIDIDEREVELIENIDEKMETSYEMETAILSSDEVKDPFKPYYLTEEEKENMLMLEKIYSEDGVWYTEIKFNEFLYKLTEGDIFANVYKLQAINENSVVLLKGDEIITISLGQLLYD